MLTFMQLPKEDVVTYVKELASSAQQAANDKLRGKTNLKSSDAIKLYNGDSDDSEEFILV